MQNKFDDLLSGLSPQDTKALMDALQKKMSDPEEASETPEMEMAEHKMGDDAVDPREIDAKKGVVTELMQMLRGMDHDTMSKATDKPVDLPVPDDVEVKKVEIAPLPMDEFMPKKKKPM